MSENRFDSAAATWDDDPGRMAVTRAIAKAIEECVPLSSDMSMLDFGCGTGTLSVLLADRVKSVDAVDSSTGMIAEAQRKLEALPELAANLKVSVLTGPVEDAVQGEWDLVCSAMVLHHVENAVGTLRHLAGCVRPGGWLALADLFTEDGSFHGQAAVPHQGFEPQALAGVLEDAGFVDTQVRTALTFPKPCDDGETREYSIFLLTGRRG